MEKIMNWLKKRIEVIRTNCKQDKQKPKKPNKKTIAKVLTRISRNITILITIGIILNVINSYFCPELSEKFPAIYGWFDGWAQFGNFVFTVAFKGIYSLLTGHLAEFRTEYTEACKDLFQQFVSWINTLQF